MTPRLSWAEQGAGALLFLFVLGLGLCSVHSPSTWTHLATGRFIVESGALPVGDPFSYTSGGAAWWAPDWLADALFHRLDAWGGARAVVGLKAAVVAGAFALLLPLCAGDLLLGAGALAIAACGAWPGLVELPSCFDFLFAALLLRLLRRRAAFAPSLLWQTAAVQFAWASLHAGGAWIGVALAAIRAVESGIRATPRERLGWAALVAVACAAVAANPHGGPALSRLFGRGVEALAEWRVQPHFFNVYGLYLAAGVASAWVCLQEEFFLSVSAMFLLAVSLLAPAQAPLYLLAAGPLVALGLGRFLEPRAVTPRGLAWLAALLGAAFLSYAVNVSAVAGRLRGYTTRQTPEGAVQFLEANRVGGKMFNDLPSAPYLLWRAAGSRPVFVDDRPGLYERDFLIDAKRWPERWSILDGIHRFDYVVVENAASGYPCRALDEDPAWALAYWDDAALVYLRRGGPNDRAVKASAFEQLRPNDLFQPFEPAALRDPKAAAAALEEAARALRQAPAATLPPLVQAFLLQSLGRGGEADAPLRAAATRPFWKPEHHALFGAVLELRGEGAGALKSYRRALGTAARAGDRLLQAELHVRMGALHGRLGRALRARYHLRRASDLDPSRRPPP